MPLEPRQLGGRLRLLEPAALKSAQKDLYETIDQTMVPWADAAPFQSKTMGGRLIGPFNAALFSPEIGAAFLALQAAEEKHTALDDRVRQVVIVTVGAAWKAPYELYAHAAVARKAGLSEEAVRALSTGEPSAELSDKERAAREFTRRLTAERTVDDGVYQTAASHFDEKALVDIVMPAGCYHVVCSLLNAFAVPAPDHPSTKEP